MYENAMEDRTGGVIAQNTYWRGAAHSNSEDSIGTRNQAKRGKKQTNQNENPISRWRGRNGRVRDFADTERAERNT